MSALAPDCTAVRAVLADHLDDLLEADHAARVTQHLAACAGCGAAAQRAAQEKRLRETAWDVPALRRGVAEVVRASRGPGSAHAARRWLGHAAAFAAGVLATLVCRPAVTAPPELAASPAAPVTTAAPAPSPSEALVYAPRRIR